jgi:hypothetical protein
MTKLVVNFTESLSAGEAAQFTRLCGEEFNIFFEELNKSAVVVLKKHSETGLANLRRLHAGSAFDSVAGAAFGRVDSDFAKVESVEMLDDAA